MARLDLLGVFLGLLLALPCIWHGQRQVNPEAQLLLVPEVIQPSYQSLQ